MGRKRAWTAAGALAIAFAALPPAAPAHPERPTFYPDPGQGTFPKHRNTGKARVVCKPDSGRRIAKRVKNRKLRARNLKLLRSCRFQHIQQAVNAARNGDRVLILPGVYNEEPSRANPNPDPRCKDMYVLAASGSRDTPTYEYEVNCPNSRQLIAILGDSLADPDRRCDSKCNLQVEGTGDDRRDVLIVGDRRKENVIKADRADGVYLANFTIQYSDYNNIYVLETDGFRFRNIESRWSEEYGFLSFASDHGIYEHLEAYGAGDSGVYPGSGPETHGSRYGIKLRYNDIHDNLQGNAGAAGNGLWYYKNKFHHNGIGIVVDSFSAGHPGMPQDSSKFSHNEIYSNNRDYFTPERDEYCKKPVLERDPKVVCPAIMIPIGTGILIAGGNENITADNRIWDNWRHGVMQIWVEASFRGENEPEKQTDTSNGNRYLGNHMGADPSGARAPNGNDFFWDEQGAGNCWMGNVGLGAGGAVSGDPGALPECPGSEVKRPVNPAKHAFLVPCATWDPYENTDPPGCDWMTLPPKPE